MVEISNENKAVNLEDLGTATTEIKRDILTEINEPINTSNGYLKNIDSNISSLVPPKETEIQEGKEEVIRQPCVADTKLSFVFEKKSAKYQILNNASEVIFASFGDTCDTGIMIPSECARILVVDSTESKGSNTVTILPKASTTGDYDVVEVQQL